MQNLALVNSDLLLIIVRIFLYYLNGLIHSCRMKSYIPRHDQLSLSIIHRLQISRVLYLLLNNLHLKHITEIKTLEKTRKLSVSIIFARLKRVHGQEIAGVERVGVTL